jgi:hypothetical protein
LGELTAYSYFTNSFNNIHSLNKHNLLVLTKLLPLAFTA